MLEITDVCNNDNLEEIRLLFREYASSLKIDLSFQHFDEELANLPIGYVPPNGVLLLAVSERQAVGCVAVRRFNAQTCEMKRLYVRPQFRNLNCGAKLALEAVNAAKKLGYKRMVLDSLPSMRKAQSLYVSLGFKEIPAYRYNPVPDTVFLELTLND